MRRPRAGRRATRERQADGRLGGAEACIAAADGIESQRKGHGKSLSRKAVTLIHRPVA